MDGMNPVTVIARETFPYAGIMRSVGKSFEAAPNDARLLVLMGKVSLESDAVETTTEEVAPVRRVSRRRRLAEASPA